jgi:hypothetical protein
MNNNKNKMKKPTKSEKIVLPYSKDISNVARSLYEENKPVTIMVDLTQEAFDRGLKSRVAEILTKYGNIVRNAEWSRVISLPPYNLRSVRMLEMHYYVIDLMEYVNWRFLQSKSAFKNMGII